MLLLDGVPLLVSPLRLLHLSTQSKRRSVPSSLRVAHEVSEMEKGEKPKSTYG